MFLVPQETVDEIANQTVHRAMRFAALEGTGLGMGGMLTVVPDLGILSATTIRMIQKLSLLHGFTYSTGEEVAGLWIAAASAAGVDLGRELIEKEAIERFVPRIVERIAAKMSCEVVEKWSARLIPIVSGALGGALNYYFVREWGRRATWHFREKHQQVRSQMAHVAAHLRSLYRQQTGHDHPREAPAVVNLQADELNNRGLSLLEVILSLAILIGAGWFTIFLPKQPTKMVLDVRGPGTPNPLGLARVR